MLATFFMVLGLITAAVSPSVADVDVELVLAVDMSGSMDLDEARVQRSGYVEALRHREFIDAVTTGRTGRIAISYFEWAGSVNETSVVDWHLIENAADAAAFAEKIETRPVITRRGTSISNAIRFATSMLTGNRYAGMRRVIDVSGDGPNNIGPPVVPARDAAVDGGITVNGLAILIRPSGAVNALDRYYADCVIGGSGAFVVPVHRAEDFATAIRQKIVTEIGMTQPLPAAVPAEISRISDCRIGEKRRPAFLDRPLPTPNR